MEIPALDKKDIDKSDQRIADNDIEKDLFGGLAGYDLADEEQLECDNQHGRNIVEHEVVDLRQGKVTADHFYQRVSQEKKGKIFKILLLCRLEKDGQADQEGNACSYWNDVKEVIGDMLHRRKLPDI